MKKHPADHFEAVSRIIPDEIAVSHHGLSRTWREFEERAARLAGALAAAGMGSGDRIAIYSRNSNEYLEAHLAILKIRAVPINVNYRYVQNELRYIFSDADVKAVIFQAKFAPVLNDIRKLLPALSCFIEIDDASGQHFADALGYEALIATTAALAPIERFEEDHYLLYTGGTTGAPKAAVYRIADFYSRHMRTFELRGLLRPQTEEALAEVIAGLDDEGRLPRALVACPLMHGTGLFLGAFYPQLIGGRTITVDTPRFDPDALWQTVQDMAVTELTIVGDAFAAPMVTALREAAERGTPYDLASLETIYSSGVMFSQASKQAFLEFCDVTVYDFLGSTEGSYAFEASSRASPPALTTQFTPSEMTKVFTEAGQEVTPGSGEVGALACGGIVPLEYLNDPEKSAATFRTVAGHRYTFPGDMATVREDGTLLLLGRGSHCINTGGEKVFPEEVEEAVKALCGVQDCLVIGENDERMGQKIVALVSFELGSERDAMSLIGEMRGRIAGYKLPKIIVAAAEVPRQANGKPDYPRVRELVSESVSRVISQAS